MYTWVEGAEMSSMNTVVTYQKNVIKDLLWLINFDQHELAVSLWSDYQRHVVRSCDGCLNETSACTFTCGKCMEFALQRSTNNADNVDAPFGYLS